MCTSATHVHAFFLHGAQQLNSINVRFATSISRRCVESALQLKAAPRPLGPDSKDGYGCDNMSVLIVQLKDRVKSRARAHSCTPCQNPLNSMPVWSPQHWRNSLPPCHAEMLSPVQDASNAVGRPWLLA